MSSLTYQKTVYASYLIGIASVITMPDVVFGLLLELMHTLLELVHLLFELVEATLDHIIEHIFHTDVHETQIIGFYLIVTMVFGGLYCLCRAMPRAYLKLKENLLTTWLQCKTSLLLYWAKQNLINKIKIIAMLYVGLTCFFLFGF